MTDKYFRTIMTELATTLNGFDITHQPRLQDQPYREELSDGEQAFERIQEVTKGRFGMMLSEIMERFEDEMEDSPNGHVCATCIQLAFEKTSPGCVETYSCWAGRSSINMQ
jgi:hypothetical protein